MSCPEIKSLTFSAATGVNTTTPGQSNNAASVAGALYPY